MTLVTFPESQRQVYNFHLACVGGDQATRKWPLSIDRPTYIGRHDADLDTPEIDLWPDGKVSRQHARIWHEDQQWWIEDLNSKHGTALGNQILKARGQSRLMPWSEFRVGETTLMLAPPGWRQLSLNRLLIDLGVSSLVNFSLVHCNFPLVSRLVIRNRGQEASAAGQLEFAIPGIGAADGIPIPRLVPGANVELPPPHFGFDPAVMQCRTDRLRIELLVRLDSRLFLGGPIECWLVPHNEWSLLPEHRLSLAAFVIPNHPIVSQLALDSCGQVSIATDAESFVEHLYTQLYRDWSLSYRLELPSISFQ